MRDPKTITSLSELSDARARAQVTPQTSTLQQSLDRLVAPGTYRTPPAGGQLDSVISRLEPRQDITTPVSNTRKDRLSKRDLLSSENMSVIRDYMNRRYGADMMRRYRTDEALMERYVDSLRFFNGNVIGTVGEATWVTDASDEDKAAAAAAYDLFDRLGNVFTVDGLGGAVDGIKDYLFAAARDPSTYAGIFTGGAAKAGTLGSQLATKEAIRRAARMAGARAAAKGASVEAQEAAVREAVQGVIKQIGNKQISSNTRNRLLDVAADNARRAYTERLRKDGEQAFLDNIAKRGVNRKLRSSGKRIRQMGTDQAMQMGFGIDALAAAIHDNQIQNVMIEVGAQEKYSAMQTAIGAFVGGIGAPLLQVGSDVVSKKLGRRVSAGELAAGRIKQETAGVVATALEAGDSRKVVNEIKDAARTWKEKVNAGLASEYDKTRVPEQFFTDLIFGNEENGIKGLMSIFNDKGVAIPQNVRVTDFFTNLIRDLDDDEMKVITDELVGLGIQLSDVMGGRISLGDMWASKVSKAASLLAVSSRIRRTMNLGMVSAELAIKEQADEMRGDPTAKSNWGGYIQSLWRRLLVSNPATSAVNVAGFGLYYGGTAVSEVLATAPLGLQGVVANLRGRDGSKYFRQARSLFELQTTKIANLLDPHATRNNFEELLQQVEGATDIMVDNLTGGIDVGPSRYNIDANEVGPVKAAENIANLASVLTMVRAQDGVTKSQFFMAEMDKQLRLRYDRTLDDVMRSGDLHLMDPKLVNRVLDDTMKSIFSRDVVSERTNTVPLLRSLAQTVENISNTPLVGQVLPFGRLMNSVVANLYRFGPGGLFKFGGDLMKGNLNYDSYEALGRSATMLSFLLAAQEFDKGRKEDDLGMFDIRVGDSVVNMENTFPASLFLLGGRILNDFEQGYKNPETATLMQRALAGAGNVSGQQVLKLGEQIAIGQIASDVQFGSDWERMLTTITSDDVSTWKKTGQLINQSLGGFAAGFTRPLDAINKIVGAATGTDYARDIRQAGVAESFTQGATKYVDNIAEALSKAVDGNPNVPMVTGETLRMATRGGDQRNPNSALAMLGIRQEPNRTASQAILDSIDMPQYEANFRSVNPAYDRLANNMVYDVLERRLQALRDSPRFQRVSKRDKRQMIKLEIQIAKDLVRQTIDNPRAVSGDTYMEGLRRKAMSLPAAKRSFAIEKMRENHGSDVSLQDLTLPELQTFLYYADIYEDVLEYM